MSHLRGRGPLDKNTEDENTESGPSGLGHDLRLVPMALGAWLGAGLGVGISVATAVWIAVSAGLLTAAVVVGGRRRLPAAVHTAFCLALCGLLVAGAAAQLQSTRRTSGPIGPLVADRATVTADVMVRAPPLRVRSTSFDGQPRWLIRVVAVSVSGRGEAGPSRAPLLIVGGDAWAEVQPGQQVRVTGRLQPTDPGDAAVAFLRPSGPPEVVAEPDRADQRVATVRQRFREACEVLPEGPGGLLPGLVIGDTSRLPADLDEAMRTTGLTHLTAVSGANITIVCGAVLLVLTACGLRRLWRLAAAGVAMLAFVAVAGTEPSVLRAAVMGAVGLVGLAASRPGAGIPPLGLAVLGLVVVDPWLARAPGFAMSVLATGGLVLLARPIAADLQVLMPRWLALATAVPVAAQAAVGPVVILVNPALPVYTVPANLVVAPAIAPATVLGAAAAAVAPVAMPLARVLIWVAGWPLRWVEWAAHVFAGLPAASIPWPDGVAGAVLLAVLTVCALGGAHLILGPRRPADQVTVPSGGVSTPIDSGPEEARLAITGLADSRRHSGRSPAQPTARKNRRTAGRTTARSVVPILAALVLAWSWWTPAQRLVTGWPPGDWQLVMCDVGQGNGVLIRTDTSSAIVIDVGPDPAAMDGCLSRLGVTAIDLLVLSHFHADHIGGLKGALNGRRTEAALVTGLAEPAAQAAQVQVVLAADGVATTVAARGLSGRAGSVQWQVLGPAGEILTGGSAPSPSRHPGQPGGEGSGPNDASLVLRVTTGSFSAIVLGDLETDGQRALLRTLRQNPQIAESDVVVVAHHGSATQVAALYETLSPRLALISVGTDNDYGHPAAPTLRMLDDLEVPVVRTDECSDIAVLAPADGPAGNLGYRCRSP